MLLTIFGEARKPGVCTFLLLTFSVSSFLPKMCEIIARSSNISVHFELDGAQRVHISAKWICNTIMTSEWSLCWPMPWRHRCTACCGKSILRDISVTFLYISPKAPLRFWTWLYLQKANKTTFPTIPFPYGNNVNFSHTSQIHFSANNTSFRPFKPMGLIAHRQTLRHTDTQKWKQYILGGYNYSDRSEMTTSNWA